MFLGICNKDFFKEEKVGELYEEYKRIYINTVVGIKDSVKSASDIKESDLLILDSRDCKLERMDTKYSRFMATGKETNKKYTGYYLRLLK